MLSASFCSAAHGQGIVVVYKQVLAIRTSGRDCSSTPPDLVHWLLNFRNVRNGVPQHLWLCFPQFGSFPWHPDPVAFRTLQLPHIRQALLKCSHFQPLRHPVCNGSMRCRQAVVWVRKSERMRVAPQDECWNARYKFDLALFSPLQPCIGAVE